MRRSANPFAPSQEAAQEERDEIIRKYLEFLSQTKIKVPHPTALAKFVAKHITEVQGRPCSHTTLLRNERYLLPMLTYLAGKGVKKAKPALSVQDRAMVLTAELAASNSEKDNVRLKLYCGHLEDQIEKLKGEGRRIAVLPSEGATSLTVSDAELRFIRTCQTLRLIAEKFNSVLSIDMEGARILDLTLRRNNVIVDSELARPFIEWLRDAK